MKQILQNISNGRRSIASLPDPMVQPGQVLIANAASLISAGTEKMVMDLAGKSLIAKARERPDHVRRVLEKVRSEGLFETLKQVRAKLDEPMKLGYSSAGTVLACGAGVQDFKPGDRVASNGPHAGVVSVPRHLVARMPDSVGFEAASFTVVASIALQGLRLAQPQIGETVLVLGLGLVGQLAVRLLAASGVRVLGTDPDEAKCRLAVELGAFHAAPGLGAADVEALTGGWGADKVLICASTPSQQPVTLAADAVRKKGRIVLVGVVGLELDRRPFYFKEAEFVVSCSYGPGRYDAAYEEKGQDYPYPYVRFTEQRNMQAVLDLMGSGRLDVAPLVTHRFAIEDAEQAYRIIEEGRERYLGMVLGYPPLAPLRRVAVAPAPAAGTRAGAGASVGVAVLGAGSFARSVLVPALRRQPGLRLHTLCSAGGVSALNLAEKGGFEFATTDEDAAFDSPEVGAVVVLTRHSEHGRQVLRAVRAGKHVFTEKPLCLTVDELDAIEAALLEKGAQAPLVSVGFNRRHAPAALAVKGFFAGAQAPLAVSVRFNAGAIPPDHWTQDEAIGGGRLVGEACHAIDLATFLHGSPPVRVFAESIGGSAAPAATDDQCFITLRHADGGISNVAYLAGGDKSFPKERVEVIGAGRVAVIDDFRAWTLTRGGRTSRHGGRQDKGHLAGVAAFARALAGRGETTPWQDLRAVTLAALLAVRSLREGQPMDLG